MSGKTVNTLFFAISRASWLLEEKFWTFLNFPSNSMLKFVKDQCQRCHFDQDIPQHVKKTQKQNQHFACHFKIWRYGLISHVLPCTVGFCCFNWLALICIYSFQVFRLWWWLLILSAFYICIFKNFLMFNWILKVLHGLNIFHIPFTKDTAPPPITSWHFKINILLAIIEWINPCMEKDDTLTQHNYQIKCMCLWINKSVKSQDLHWSVKEPQKSVRTQQYQ